MCMGAAKKQNDQLRALSSGGTTGAGYSPIDPVQAMGRGMGRRKAARGPAPPDLGTGVIA